ncbi:TonB-dependent receptor [Cellulophaga tyrosinoxydans]|uniref:Outer membrane receptor for ferrienterochelin and colicins n=1 Tax=Cellulophaga tyrosinoxydans TaxID=504486 RepID=A0A1W2ASG0_9FLAO|nr:TonB-dependent receptor plug domain-containing protein [Cellulophaga tyrosinoxydans]SMC63450.1 Outer membrane receptor for ferrienterochelin and colicins [Cellulophaga tyrosinoxydans]
MPKTHLNNYRFYLLVAFFSISLLCNGQEKSTAPIPLITFLEELENKFQIKFSYLDEDLKDFQVKKLDSDNLKDILTSLKNQTNLSFLKLDDRYYSITSQNITICAQVFDNFMQSTLPNASVQVLEPSISIATDESGTFILEDIPRKAVIEIRHIGFKPLFITAEDLIKKGNCSKIPLSQIYQELKEVIVYKFLTTGILKQQDASILLKTKDFGILPGQIEPDVLQTVQALPGIKSIDETVSDINVRGGTNDQNLILWDGIKMYQSGHFFGLISAFNPYLTEKVTTIKNGTSAAFGDGVSSVISMETKDELSDTFYGGGGINLISGDAYGQIPISDKLGLQFSGRRSITDFLNTPTYKRFYERAFQDTEVNSNNPNPDEFIRNEDFYFYDFSGKLLFDVNDTHKLRLNLIAINNFLDYQETNTNTNETTQSGLAQTNFSIGGNLNSFWNADFSTFLNVYYTSYNLDSQNIKLNPSQQLYQNNKVLETAIHLRSNYVFSNLISWENGYQFNEVGITNFTNVTQPPYRSNIKGVIRTHALFSEFTYASENEKFWIRSGARLNFIENIDTFKKLLIEPRLNLNYELAEDVTLELQGEFKNQTTNQVIDLKQNFLGIEKRRWVLSDDNTLPVTQSKQASLGISYDKNKLFIGLEGFYKFVNGISTSTQGFQNEDQFNGEIGKYTVNGLEFLINQKSKNLSNWFSYTYNNNSYTFETLNPQKFPNNIDIKHTLTFASTYTYENVKLGIGLNYHTGRPFTKPQENNAVNTSTFPYTINYQSPNSSRIKDYIRADASAVYDFKISERIDASFGASVLNLLNRKNTLNTYYRLNDADEVETIENISLGITPNFSFRIFF